MWNIIKKYRLALTLICLPLLIACDNDKASVNSDKTIEIVNYDSSGFNCRMERIQYLEGSGIRICQILINDTIALFREQTSVNQLQVTLTQPVRDFLKLLLYDIYAKNSSAIKEQYLNETRYITNVKSEWKIAMNMVGKKINEKIDTFDFRFTFDQPFHPQFDRLLELIYAITVKMEQDIFRIENTDYNPEEWITDMFHGEFYEPYNDIKSINYQ
ncbi:MAG: hypothetical protein BHV69_02580 [Bacteroidales bacterium 52_46]|nr:MAG: hypothetical protein BHV69_02580 [Bacteroidales bacterium 52_46]